MVAVLLRATKKPAFVARQPVQLGSKTLNFTTARYCGGASAADCGAALINVFARSKIAIVKPYPQIGEPAIDMQMTCSQQ
ncbi:hypothetical protein [Ornithinimicrobium sp. INDO-MA30-4]|uniref:hypothetical protein n=1 Tax=Ornithinimicrobium sp. INDO-MA30-4 TaxID=2908651 RepID=UPI001F2D3C0A|nr:hypothetical protein [Ornithinimicrobium sp. INDO-MA30-4]UJH70628.1 hypothetical protein L0A91_00430 [Ornithinimicrobium sp. INDO-MA30-4]